MKRTALSKLAPVTYTIMDELMASPKQPMPEEHRIHQTRVMRQSLHALEAHDSPSATDWRIVSDCVNLMETLVREMKLCEDPGQLLTDAVTAMAYAGKRKFTHGKIRLDGPGIAAVRDILADYESVIQQLPHRTIINCHRRTERRIRKILNGQRQSHDVEVVDL